MTKPATKGGRLEDRMNLTAKKQPEGGDSYQGLNQTPSALDVVSDYVSRLASRDSGRMDALRLLESKITIRKPLESLIRLN